MIKQNGKSIVAATLVGPLVALVAVFVFSVLPAYIFGLDVLTIGSPNANYLLQILFLVVGAGLYIGSRFFITNKCAKFLEKLDF